MRLKLDTSGFEKFLELAEMLEKGKVVSEKSWNELFDTPGYRVLINREYNRDFFVKAFTLIFNPELKEKLHEELDSSIGRYLKYYLEVKENRKNYTKDLTVIKDNWKIIEANIFSRATSFLPDHEYKNEPVISVVIFDTDARGYDNIIIDACFTESFESFVSIASHELFHHLRNQQLCYNKDKIKEEDKDIVQVLNQIHSEGIADHIDKDYFIYGNVKTAFPDDYIKQYKKHVNEAPEIISRIDKKIQELSNEEKESINIGKELKKIVPLSGHPLGYSMTKLVIKNALVGKLIKEVGNPFSFFELYNEAARRDKEVKSMFSDDFLKIIKDLEDKYSKNTS
ncbi:MAG: hypothetical protein H7641_05780 [Candidatus Heimdallarchaeota archaeon]|nr:hypothetical protein [Candidatus Heimdallarchaeota archaeon]MCK4877071.1 hypothetical protein [Candidatus Heimdallarchaeota archaeon]